MMTQKFQVSSMSGGFWGGVSVFARLVTTSLTCSLMLHKSAIFKASRKVLIESSFGICSCWQSRLRYRACQWRRDRFECRLKEYMVPLGGNGGCGTLILFLEAHILLISHARLVSGVSKQSSEIVHGAHLESLQWQITLWGPSFDNFEQRTVAVNIPLV